LEPERLKLRFGAGNRRDSAIWFPYEDQAEYRRHGGAPTQARGSASGTNNVGTGRNRSTLSLFQRQKEPAELSPLPGFNSGGAFVEIADRDALYQAMEGR
jgi:hypothetical protein